MSGLNLTLFCDASFDPSYKAAGWGAWAKKDGWKSGRFMGGVFKAPVDSASEAEVAAIVNAMFRLKGGGHMDDVARVTVQSDSMRALQVLLQKGMSTLISNHPEAAQLEQVTLKKMTKLETVAVDLLQGLVVEANVQLIARHVRGHQPGAKRQWVNRSCDKIAKEHMQKDREAKKKAK